MPVVPPCANRDERSAAKSVLIRSLVGVAEQREQQVETERQSLRLISRTKSESVRRQVTRKVGSANHDPPQGRITRSFGRLGSAPIF
jgi:hypothetical protein